MIKDNTKFSRVALKAGVASFVLAIGLSAVPALAAAAASNEKAAADAKADAKVAATASEDNMEQIVVTGTLFRDPNTFLTSPVGVIGEKEITLRQQSNAEQLLRDLPGIVPSIGAQVNNGNGGASYVNLRGLGNQRNVVLLDGSRVVPSDLYGAVNVDNIPVALLQRVDVLTGGATTTYGADAVAGVVNFITRRDFSGASLNVTNGITQLGDGNSFRADLTLGANFDDNRGNVVLGIGYQNTQAVYQGDRGFSFYNLSSRTGAKGGSPTGVPAYLEDANSIAGQIDPTAGVIINDGNFSGFNFNPYNIFQTPQERWNIYGAGRYELNDSIEVYAVGMFSRGTVSTIVAPSGTFGNTLTTNYNNPFLPAGIAAQFCNSNGLTTVQCAAARAATGPSDPNYATFDADIYRRFTESGTRDNDYTTTMFQVKGGLRGALTEHLNWDVYGLYGSSDNVSVQSGNGLYSRLTQATLTNDGTTCISGAKGCVPINLFGGDGSISPASLAYLNVPTSSNNSTTILDFNGTISGDLGVAMPWTTSPVQVAVGLEYRKYTAATGSDLPTATPNEVLGNGAANPPVYGEYDVKEAFGELQIPIASGVTGAQLLQLELGGRYSDYSSAGTAFTWKIGGAWAPIDEIKFRGNYNKGSRAPSIGELYAPQVVGLGSLSNDPCSGAKPLASAALAAICLAQGAPSTKIGSIPNPSANQPNTLTGGNPDLGLEKATTWTAGVVLMTPKISGVTLTVDYYNIKITDAITTPNISDVINGCYSPAFNPGLAFNAACASIGRSPVSGGLSGSANTRGIPLFYSNQGTIFTDGIDLALNAAGPLGGGQLSASFLANWTLNSEFQATPASINRECVGLYSVNCASIQPKFSFNQRTTYQWSMFTASLLWRYIGSQNVEPNISVILPAYSSIGAANYFDFTFQAEPVKNVTLTFLVSNLFNKMPPIVGTGVGTTAYNSGNTYPSTYDPLGRRFTVGANLKF